MIVITVSNRARRRGTPKHIIGITQLRLLLLHLRLHSHLHVCHIITLLHPLHIGRETRVRIPRLSSSTSLLPHQHPSIIARTQQRRARHIPFHSPHITTVPSQHTLHRPRQPTPINTIHLPLHLHDSHRAVGTARRDQMLRPRHVRTPRNTPNIECP